MSAFYLDNDVPVALARILDSRGHDVLTTRAMGFQLASDPFQLWYAALSGRTLITHNWKDFQLLHEAWRVWFSPLQRRPPLPARLGIWRLRSLRLVPPALDHAGILVIPQGWPLQLLANEIDRFVGTFPSPTGHLWRLRSHGWQHER
ncbi:MAG: DUF5615 family PIN-like protein [Sphaerobacter sp.]|nr:DUF5615 family PIN-like protein [Sphaerobacter sp.]